MKRELKESFEIDDEFIDSIVDEILKTRKPSEQKLTEKEAVHKWNLGEIVKLKNRLSALENRVEKYITSFKINATETGREISERYANLDKENEQQIMILQGQLEDLRTALIRVSNEVKRLRDIISPK